MTPKVSVIVPVYNCETYIANCLESLLNQTYKNIEILVIDDGSRDNSEKIVSHYKKKDNRISYYYQTNRGPSGARNRGLLQSTGKYVVFVDSDDSVDKHYVEYLINKMLESNSDLVCCGYKEMSEFGIVDYVDFDSNSIASVRVFMETVCRGTGGVLWGKIFKKEIIAKYKLRLDTNIFMCEDLVFVLQYSSYCISFDYIDHCLYNYNRLNQNSISSNLSIDYMQNYVSVCQYIEKIFNSAGIEEYKIDQVITRRVQDMVINLIERQIVNINKNGLQNAILNVKQILSFDYIDKYKYNFRTSSFHYKPYIFFAKHKFVKVTVIYGVYINFLRNLKRTILKRR